MAETYRSIGDWIEDTFQPNDFIDRYSTVHLDRVLDEIVELEMSLNPPSGVGGVRMSEVGQEAADVVIALAGMCRRYGIDLQEEVDKKMSVNRARKWKVFSNGTGKHVKEVQA